MFGGSGSTASAASAAGTASAASAAGTDIYRAMLSVFGSSFANGGVFDGGVVSSPTGFYSGGKLNQVGEAGPEAILPLSRDSQGRLGLAGAGSAGKSVTIVSSPVINIDSRTDRAEIMQLVGGALQQNNRQMMDNLSEAGVLPR
jgi:phage-related minor tail protein